MEWSECEQVSTGDCRKLRSRAVVNGGDAMGLWVGDGGGGGGGLTRKFETQPFVAMLCCPLARFALDGNHSVVLLSNW